MLIQRVNRTDAEKVYLICQNGEATSISTGMGARYLGGIAGEVVSSDGVQVCKLATGTTGDATFYQFAGIADQDIASLGYGRIQAWGFCNSVLLSQETDKTCGLLARADSLLKCGGASGSFTSVGYAGTNCSTLTVGAVVGYGKFVQNMTTCNISGSLPYTKAFVRAL
jgi:hypothetical protein